MQLTHGDGNFYGETTTYHTNLDRHRYCLWPSSHLPCHAPLSHAHLLTNQYRERMHLRSRLHLCACKCACLGMYIGARVIHQSYR